MATVSFHLASARPAGSSMHQVSPEELQSFAEAIGLSRVAGGRCSTLFLLQIYAETFLPQSFSNAFKVVAEIAHLEGVGRSSHTKAAAAFERPPLLGLKKKHYLVGGKASVARNIMLASGKKNREFRRIAERNYINETIHLSPANIAKNIANDIVKLYLNRSRKRSLTGNWIIFAEQNGQNYYLCLAAHDDGDDLIAEKIKTACSEEFPFLRSIMTAPS
ncbi:hypothetical protein [Azospirillum argentinense]|uniref:hypothetical protein n=1 Tax=Azospirillum argentinense TaxID=2970906 RepID=UPI0032DFFF9E